MDLFSSIKTSCIVHGYTDNISAIMLPSNPILHSKTKHFELDLHFVRDHLRQRHLKLTHIPSKFQVAYTLTKPFILGIFCYV